MILCGDFNVAISDLALGDPGKERGMAGATMQERDMFNRLIDCGFTDSFRYFHPDMAKAYIWWSYMMRNRIRKVGWRVDYFLVSESLLPALKDARILRDVMRSDYCPIEIIIELNRLP